MAIVPGKAVVFQPFLVDEVEKSFELFQRIRAYFMTLAFVSISIPDWFAL